jgi:hypothetical protein
MRETGLRALPGDLGPVEVEQRSERDETTEEWIRIEQFFLRGTFTVFYVIFPGVLKFFTAPLEDRVTAGHSLGITGSEYTLFILSA